MRSDASAPLRVKANYRSPQKVGSPLVVLTESGKGGGVKLVGTESSKTTPISAMMGLEIVV